MKSIYSSLLSFHPNLACCLRLDRFASDILRSQNSRKSGLCRAFSSSKSSPYGFWLISWMNEWMNEWARWMKRASDVDFYHRLFEIVINLDYECDGWLLLVKHTEINSRLFKALNNIILSFWKMLVAWRTNIMTLTRSRVRTARTASSMWCK
jgi:hypothetical protein